MATDSIAEESNSMTSNMDSEIPDVELTKENIAKEFDLNGQHTEAMKEYSEHIKLVLDPAACYTSTGYKKVTKKQNRLESYINMIERRIFFGEIDLAEITCKKLLEISPGHEKVDMYMKSLNYLRKMLKNADAAYRSKDYLQVVHCMDCCYSISCQCSKFRLIKAESLAFLGRYQQARKIVNDVLYTNNQNADALYVHAVCFYLEGDIDRALALFQITLELAPEHTKALEIYKKAKQLKKKKAEGNIAYKWQQYQEAHKLYAEALTIDPQNTVMNAKLHFNKATVAAKLGMLNESVAECTEALKLDKNYLKALLRRAMSYMELNNYKEAVYDLERVCEMDNSHENKRLLMTAKLALKKPKRKDYYRILGIGKTASVDDIKKAYKQKAMVHHPDRHPNATDGEKKEQEGKFKEVSEAYEILSDLKKRLRYDNEYDIDDSFNPIVVFKMYFRPRNDYQYKTSGFQGGFSGSFPGGFGDDYYTFQFD